MGKGRRELGIGGLRQAGLAKWAASQLVGPPAKVKRKMLHQSKGSQAGLKSQNLPGRCQGAKLEDKGRKLAREEMCDCKSV